MLTMNAGLILKTCILTIICTQGHSVGTPITDYAAALRRELFANGRYDQFNSPYKYYGNKPNQSTVTPISIRLKLLVLHIYDMDEFTGTLTTNAWFLAVWKDYRLEWEPANYGGVYHIQAPDRSVWVPDLVLINNVEAMEMDNFGDANIDIYSKGNVFWTAPVTFKSTCYIDHKLYPFDEHSCIIVMRLWAMDVTHYSLNVEIIERQDEVELLKHFSSENPLWEITSRIEKINYVTFSCCPNTPVPCFQVELGLRRRAPLYQYILITPGLLSALMCLALFWLPPAAAAKINLGGLIVAVQLALLMFLGWKIPAGGKTIPAIVLFCGNTLIMSSLSIVISVLVIRLSNIHKETPIPEGIKFLNRGFCRSILCFGFSESQVWVRFVSKVAFANRNKKDAELLDTEGAEVDHQTDLHLNTSKPPLPSDWYLIGAAVDRLCFIIYCFILIVIIISSFS